MNANAPYKIVRAGERDFPSASTEAKAKVKGQSGTRGENKF